MNSLKASIKKFEESNEFKKFKEKHKNYFLTSAFLNLESEDDLEFTPWELNYFSKADNKAHSFLVSENIMIREPDKMFSVGQEVKELNINKVKINLDQALTKIKEILNEKYKNETPSRIIIILQKLNENIVWNFTYITKTLKVINIKLDAISREIIHESAENILNFRQNL